MLAAKTCKQCGYAGHTKFSCRERPQKPCKYCKKSGHFSFMCGGKPKAPLFCTNCDWEGHDRMHCPNRIKPKTHGKHYKLWEVTRRRWFKENKADNYTCYLCDKFMFKNETTLDHKLSRGRHPELRYVLSNLAPCCNPCNVDKGSLDEDEYREKKAYYSQPIDLP